MNGEVEGDILKKEEVSGDGKERKILSIDGGGIKGTIPASFLASVENTTDKSIVEHFDLIVGTSTGGIIALGLALGISASKILDFYLESGPIIFGRREGSKEAIGRRSLGRVLRPLRQLFASKYSLDGLRNALHGAFGESTLGDCRTRVAIPAFNARQRSVYVFKTAHHQHFETDWRESAAEVALATAAAPTFFNQHELRTGTALIDGGIWANNPAGLAVVEAIGVLGWPAQNLRVLSLGCSDEAVAIPENSGTIGLATKIADLFMMGQSHGSLGTAKLLLKDRRHLLRIQHTAPAGTFGLDKTENLEQLRGIGASLARDHLPQIRRLFLDHSREEFIPFHPVSEGRSL